MKPNALKKKIGWQKVTVGDGYNLHQAEKDPTTFSVRWKRLDDTYGSRRFKAQDLKSALEMAPVIAGLQPAQRQEMVRLSNAFNEALGQTSRGAKSRHDWNYSVKRFLMWLATYDSNCRYWHLLTRKIIRDYMATLDGKSATTRRLSMQPICQTAGYMHREYGFVHFAERLGIGSKLKNTPCEVYIEDVAEFCDHLLETNPRLEVGVALQGLAGLQVQEATRLSWKKVDLARGLIEISGIVKNPYRKRVIPVADRVLEALRRADGRRGALQSRKVQPISEHVLVSKTGFPYEDWWQNYTKEVQAALRQWNPAIDWKTKDLRNCLPTFAVIQGLHNDVWEQYLGHVPASVTARHYIPRLASASLGESNALERQASLFRLQVTDHIDRAVTALGKKPILNFFEPDTGETNNVVEGNGPNFSVINGTPETI